MKEHIKNRVRNLIEINQTKDIYKLCDIYNVNVLYVNIEKKGIFLPDGKNNFIFINKTLNLQEKEDIVIHEFSHFILHKEILLWQKRGQIQKKA